MVRKKSVKFYALLQELGTSKEEFWAFCEENAQNLHLGVSKLNYLLCVIDTKKSIAYVFEFSKRTPKPLHNTVAMFLCKILNCNSYWYTSQYSLKFISATQRVSVGLPTILPPALIRHEKAKLDEKLKMLQAQCPHTTRFKRYPAVGLILQICEHCGLRLPDQKFEELLKSR